MSPFEGPIAQRLEQATHNRLVVGSIPTGPTISVAGSYVKPHELIFFVWATSGPLFKVCNASAWVSPRYQRSFLRFGMVRKAGECRAETKDAELLLQEAGLLRHRRANL